MAGHRIASLLKASPKGEGFHPSQRETLRARVELGSPPHRLVEDSPFRVPLDHHRYCVLCVSPSGRDWCCPTRFGFDMDPDGPDESQQLATKRSHDLLFTFPPSRECAVA